MSQRKTAPHYFFVKKRINSFKLNLLKSLFNDIWYITSGIAFYKYLNTTKILLQRQCTRGNHFHKDSLTSQSQIRSYTREILLCCDRLQGRFVFQFVVFQMEFLRDLPPRAAVKEVVCTAFVRTRFQLRFHARSTCQP